MHQPVLLIFREQLLPLSETFILSQAEGLTGFVPVYFGMKSVSGLPVPRDRMIVVNTGGPVGRAREIVAKLGVVQDFGLRKLRPALVHAHFGPDGMMALPVAKKCRAPLVVTLHGFDITRDDVTLARSGYVNRNYVRTRPRLYAGSAMFIAVSEFIRAEALKKGFPAEKLVVHYTGVDCEVFSADPTISREPVVLFVGRLVPEKGCEHLLAAMESVQRDVPAARLIVIGDGPMRGDLERRARECLRNCEFLGSQSHTVVRFWLNRARVVSIPSVSEAFGMAFAEAQAMGVPVASFATGGIPEAVEHGVTGLLASTGDVRSLARHITTLLDDAGLWRDMSQAAAQRIRRKFNLRMQSQRLEDLYRTVIARHAPHRIAATPRLSSAC